MAVKISTMGEWEALDYYFPAHVMWARADEKKDTPEGKMTGTWLRRIYRAVELHNDVVAVGPLRDDLDEECAKYDRLYGE